MSHSVESNFGTSKRSVLIDDPFFNHFELNNEMLKGVFFFSIYFFEIILRC